MRFIKSQFAVFDLINKRVRLMYANISFGISDFFFNQSNLMVIRISFFFFSSFKPALWFIYGVVGPLH